jgi:hypothetical protein
MSAAAAMPSGYQSLAYERASKRFLDYMQPEDFGYDFRDWVSPYTKGAHAFGTIALVLQDWSSSEVLGRGVDPEVQAIGRMARLKTNRYLETLLEKIFGLHLSGTYVTNAFPYIKQGSISAPVPTEHVVQTVDRFTRHELEIVRPKRIIALGALAGRSLARSGIDCTEVPHPAARIGGLDAHEAIWRQRLGFPLNST